MGLALKNLLFTVLVPGTVAVYLPLWIARAQPAASPHALRTIPALLLLALGAAVYAWCLWDFAAFGRGTPAPIDAPKRLVARGLYRVVRNPMYVGVLAAIGGWALLYGSAAIAGYGVVVAAVVHLFVVTVEEPSLRRQFGAAYERYCAGVGRWWPRLPRRAVD